MLTILKNENLPAALEGENAKAFLKANPDIAGKIDAAIRQNAGLIAEKILTGEEGDAASDDEAAEG